MTSKKQRGHSSQPEECGVWLDTAELKKRSHQTFIPCTYSNRFNPLLRRPHVHCATFEVTQTKTPQLCTKQTSMYSFFTTKGKKVVMPTSNGNLTSSLCAQERPEENYAEHRNLGLSTDYVDESSACLSTTLCNPQSNIQPSAQLWEDMHDECSKVTNSLVHPKDLLHSNSGRTENMLCSPADFCASGTTKQHSVSLLDSSISSLCPEVHAKDVYTESQLDLQLFTQDSQGNRVIAHRAGSDKKKTCCLSGPLQDRTNVPWDTGSPMKRSRQYLCDEDSLRFLFTQDSEGNMVIKH